MKYSAEQLKHIEMIIGAIAVDAGANLYKAFNQMIYSEEKTSPHDVVTHYDSDCEEFLYHRLKAAFPEFGFLGEEKGYRNYKEGEPYWIVDPIDGTLNFARSIPAFAVSIALVHHNKTLVGACYCPITKELFCAYSGGGAFLNGKSIKVSEVSSMKHAVICVSPDQLRHRKVEAVIRRQGSSVMDICYVAKGATEGFYDSSLNPWDFAASSLIAEEAGAEIFSLKTKTLDTNKKSDILVANKHLSDTLAKWILTEELTQK